MAFVKILAVLGNSGSFNVKAANTLLLHGFHDNLKTNLNVSVCRFTYLITSTFAVPPAGLLLSYKYIRGFISAAFMKPLRM